MILNYVGIMTFRNVSMLRIKKLHNSWYIIGDYSDPTTFQPIVCASIAVYQPS